MSAARSASTTVSVPSYESASYATDLPAQWGAARRASITKTALYATPADRVYNAGRILPKLGEDFVFARAIDDTYTGRNVLWAGELQVEGPQASIPDPLPDGYLMGSQFIGRFRTDINEAFSVNNHFPAGPNWFARRSITVGASQTVSVKLRNPQAGQATLIASIRGNSDGEHNLSIDVNGSEIGTAVWTGIGFRLVEITFDAALLSNGENSVELRTSQTASSQRLDYVEIQAPATAGLTEDGGLLVRIRATGRLNVPNANFAVDATTFAGESLVSTSGTYKTGSLIYFTNQARTVVFDARKAYSRPVETVEKADYVIVAPEAWLADFAPLAEHHEARGLDVETISFEQLTDIYGGGIYGPAALVRFTQIIGARYLLLGAGTTYDTRNYEGLNTNTGIPTGWIQVNDGLAASDDLYTNGLSIAVGRFPARRRSEIVPLIAKLVEFQAPNRVTLMSDLDDSQGGVDRFAHMQRALADTVPSILLETTGKSGETVRAELTASVQAGGRVVAYQGHSGFQELGRNWLDFESAHKVPPSAWLMSTCLVGSYFVNSDNLPTFAREMLNSPNSGAVSIICSTRYGHADDEHRIVERGLELMAAGTDWGNILLTLKREMTGQTIQVYTLLGDPALGSLDFSERRSLNLRSPQGGALLGGPDPIRIEFSLTGDGWWEENLRVSWSRDGSAWAPIMDFQASPGVRDYSLDWTPPADGTGYSIRVEVVE